MSAAHVTIADSKPITNLTGNDIESLKETILFIYTSAFVTEFAWCSITVLLAILLTSSNVSSSTAVFWFEE